MSGRQRGPDNDILRVPLVSPERAEFQTLLDNTNILDFTALQKLDCMDEGELCKRFGKNWSIFQTPHSHLRTEKN